MSSSSTSTSSMTIITLVKFSSIVCRIDAQISIFTGRCLVLFCLTKATNSPLSSSSSSEFPLSSLCPATTGSKANAGKQGSHV